MKSERLTELEKIMYTDLEDMVYGTERTYDEVVDILHRKYIAGSTFGNTLPPGIYESGDLNLMKKILNPNEVKQKTTVDDIRLRSNLSTNKTKKFTGKSFFIHY